MTDKDIIKLLRSGDFTIAYHDHGQCCLYKGKFDYDDLPEEEDLMFGDETIGYAPHVVEMLVKALKGKIDSI